MVVQFKKVLIDFKLADPLKIKIDYKRGIVFVDRCRVAECKSTESDALSCERSKLIEARIHVDPAKLLDAVDELMQE